MTIIAAVSPNFVIGKDGTLPWHLPEDLKLFKKLTWGKKVVVGRKTFESMGNLPNRELYVLSKNKNYNAGNGITVIHSLNEIPPDAYIIGGATVYNQTLPLATNMIITLLKFKVEGDSYFPNIPKDFYIKEVLTNTPTFSTCIFERITHNN